MPPGAHVAAHTRALRAQQHTRKSHVDVAPYQLRTSRLLLRGSDRRCVEALDEANGDLEEAATLLRKAGLAAASKKAGRGASEGAVAVAHGPAGAAVVEINSETDFVARNEIFQVLAARVARAALGLEVAGSAGSATVELPPAAISASTLDAADESVESAMGFAVSQLGENLVLRRACLLPTPAEGGVVASYAHNTYAPGVGLTIGAVVLKSRAANVDALRSLGEKLSMHVVAANPLFLDRQSVPEEAVGRERDILSEQAAQSGKPANVVEKMVSGRLNKYYGEVCLLEQAYVIDDSSGSVTKVLAAAGKELGADVELTGFVRYHVGEGAEASDE